MYSHIRGVQRRIKERSYHRSSPLTLRRTRLNRRLPSYLCYLLLPPILVSIVSRIFDDHANNCNLLFQFFLFFPFEPLLYLLRAHTRLRILPTPDSPHSLFPHSSSSSFFKSPSFSVETRPQFLSNLVITIQILAWLLSLT